MSIDPKQAVLPSAATFRKLLIIALLAETGFSVINLSTMPVYLYHNRGIGEAVIGLIVVAYLLVEAVFKGPMGSLAGRIGRKPLIVAGCMIPLATTAATLLLPRTQDGLVIAAMLGLRALDGLAAAMLWPALIVEIAQSVRKEQRSVALATANSTYLIGLGLALPFGGVANEVLGPYVAQTIGNRSPGLMVGAAVAAIAGLFALAILAKSPATQVSPDTPRMPVLQDCLEVLRRHPKVIAVAIAMYAVIGFPLPTIKLFAEKEFGISEALFGVLALPAMAIMGGLSVFVSKLSKHTPVYKSLSFGLLLMAVGLAPLALAVLLPGFRAIWALMLSIAPLGLGFLLVYPAWTAYVHDIEPDRSEVNVGTVMALQGIGAMIGAALGGWSYQWVQGITAGMRLGESGGRYAPFLGALVAAILAYVGSTRLDRTARTAKPDPQPSTESRAEDSEPPEGDSDPVAELPAYNADAVHQDPQRRDPL